MKLTLIIIGSFVGLIALAAVGTAFNLITLPWLKFNSEIATNQGIITKTYNADNALYNYHWFQETAADLTATQQKITVATQAVADFKASAGPRNTWSYAEETQYDNLTAIVLGLNTYYDDEANQYNAHASEVDRSIFQNGLPLFFNLK